MNAVLIERTNVEKEHAVKLEEMGAKVSGGKCVVWSLCSVSRVQRREHKWRRLGQPVLIENDGRY